MSSTGIRYSARRRDIFLVASLTFSALASAPHHALAAVIGLYADQNGYSCDFEEPPILGTTSVYVVLKFNQYGLTGTDFAMPIPEGAPYTIASWSSQYLVVGELETGVMVGFPSCIAEDVLVMQVDFMRIGDPTDDCYALRLVPHPYSETGEVEVVDCAFNIHPVLQNDGIGIPGYGPCPPVPPPSDPTPADGATEVVLNPELDCVLHDPEYRDGCGSLGVDSAVLHFGTDPDPPVVYRGEPFFPFPTGTLAPATTYYWKVVYWPMDVGRGVSSPVWSFTTTVTPNPVFTSTWGKIKALYR